MNVHAPVVKARAQKKITCAPLPSEGGDHGTKWMKHRKGGRGKKRREQAFEMSLEAWRVE